METLPSGRRPFRIDTVRVEPATGVLWRDDTTVRVRPQVMDLLLTLAERPGDVRSKTELLDAVWNARFVSESALTTAVAELRDALGDDSREPRFVQTVPKRGYRLVASVRIDPLPVLDAPTATPDVRFVESVERPAADQTGPIEASAEPMRRSGATPAESKPRVTGLLAWRRSASWIAAGLGSIVLVIAVSGLRGRGAEPSIPAIQVPVALGPGERWPADDVSMTALSPDATSLAYVVAIDEEQHLMLRDLATGGVTRVEGTRGAGSPFFSPDGAWLGFFQGGMLRRMPTHGAAIEPMIEVSAPFGAAWRDNGDLIFSATFRSGLMLLAADGETARPLTTPSSATQDVSHRWPDPLPEGPFVLFAALRETAPSQIRAINLATGEQHVVVEDSTRARFAAPDRIVFARGPRLVAAPFDPRTAQVTGPETEVAHDIAYASTSGLAQFSVSATGGIAFRTNPPHAPRELVLVDRSGHLTPLPAPARPYIHPRVSPDGTRLALWLDLDNTGTGDVWTYDINARSLEQQTRGGATWRPVWAPDGRRLALDAQPSATTNVFLLSLDGRRALEPLVPRDRVQAAEDWLPDGRTLVMSQVEPDTGHDLLLVDVVTRRVRPFADAPGAEMGAAVSPDGQWIAFVWIHDGESGVYISPADAEHNARVRVASHGRELRWSRDGGELFFRSGGAMFGIPITVTGGTLQAGTPAELFRGEFEVRPAARANYDVMPDGRFVMLRKKGHAAQEIVLSFNWRESAGASRRFAQ